MTIHFHDVSHWQGAYVPNGPTIAKATEGSTYVDPSFAGIMLRTLAGGWSFLPYHFLHAGDIAAQVENSIVIGEVPIMLDVEKNSDGSSKPTMKDVIDFIDARGNVVLAYIPQWYWSGYMGSCDLTPLTDRGVGLIASNYKTYSDNGVGWTPYGGVAPVIWQYTDTPLDTNAFRGTEDELQQLFEVGTMTTVDLSPAALAAIAAAVKANVPTSKANADAVWNDDIIPAGTPANPSWLAKNWVADMTKRLIALTTALTAASTKLDTTYQELVKARADNITLELSLDQALEKLAAIDAAMFTVDDIVSAVIAALPTTVPGVSTVAVEDAVSKVLTEKLAEASRLRFGVVHDTDA